MQWILIALSTVAAGLPMMAFLSVVWWLDRYDREPPAVVATAFGWGAFGAVGLSLVGSGVLAVFAALAARHAAPWVGVDPDVAAGALTAVVVAPAVEEPAKALVLLPIAFSRHFDNMTDGFVYGAAAGLGFGMTENLLYFVGTSGDVHQWLGTVLIRTFYSAVMHATATACVGAGLGWGRFRGVRVALATGALGLVLGAVIHAGWNALLTLDALVPGGALWAADLALLPVVVLAAFAVFEVCVFDETRTIRRELRDEVDRGIIPPSHPAILASWWRRMGRSWAPAGLDRRSYIAAATSLAMRKRQVRMMGSDAPGWYLEDVDLLRRKIRRLLHAAGATPAPPAPDPGST